VAFSLTFARATRTKSGGLESLFLFWSGKRDSNPRHSAWKADALPTELFPHKILVEGGGFEPPKAEPTDLQSAPFGRSGTPPTAGAGDGTRTRNLLITNQLLYRLSYASKRLLYKTIFSNTSLFPCQGLFVAPSRHSINHRDYPRKKKIAVHYAFEPKAVREVSPLIYDKGCAENQCIEN
jgi:hypothetical protein